LKTNIIINKILIFQPEELKSISCENVVRIDNKLVVLMIISLFIVSFIVQNQTQNAYEKQPHRWVAHPMYISPFAGSPTPQGYSVSQIRTAYNLPSSGGTNNTIAIIDAFHTPNILNYFNTFSNQYGLPDNRTGNFLVHKMAQNIQYDSAWSLETCLDIEWAHAIAPNATILLVEATAPTNTALLAAIDYATSRPNVVAVSMSWGGEESYDEYIYESHFSKPGVTFFASSGDDGSTVMWPASSANVVSVGGTTLNLNPDGTIISETAWRNSSGGLSAYVARPIYQTNYGLNFANRAVPDVSYNANAFTGVPVYNGTWWKLGGTSAGAPQWAAIHTLGLSATNNNLYSRAKSAYSAYFRDITQGSNYVNSTTSGYDLVTGLGSPLTFDFGTTLDVFPTSGPPNGAITLSGSGFTSGSSVNISYLNPLTSTWTPIINNLATTTENFAYATNTPDLGQNQTAGDYQAVFDNIVFRAQDNSNNRSYDTTIPYVEGRRGLTQISDNVPSLGLFGNSTDLASTLFVQNNQSIVVSGSWFIPGNATLLWDDTIDLGSSVVDGTGFFNATVQVPNTTAGQHKLTINDGSGLFCVNLTRLPMVANDYVDGWHTSDIKVNLTPDYTMNEIFYRINGGSINNLTSNGEPTISTEGSNNILEYWSTWNVYGTSINETLHVTVLGIKLDKTAPTGDITTSATTTNIPTVTLELSATDPASENIQMHFSNDNNSWSNWEPFTPLKTWNLQEGDGQKTVFVQFMDDAGLSSTYSYKLTLETPQSMTILTQTSAPTQVPTPTASLSPKPSPTPNPIASSTPIETQTPAPTSLPEAPEWVLILIAISTLLLVLLFRRKIK
jgi:hypothetical protein